MTQGAAPALRRKGLFFIIVLRLYKSTKNRREKSGGFLVCALSRKKIGYVPCGAAALCARNSPAVMPVSALKKRAKLCGVGKFR